MQSLGEWIRAARILKGWSQSHLAKVAGFTTDTISRAERNRASLKPNSLRAIGMALGVQYDDIPKDVRDQAKPSSRLKPSPDAVVAVYMPLDLYNVLAAAGAKVGRDVLQYLAWRHDLKTVTILAQESAPEAAPRPAARRSQKRSRSKSHQG